MRKLKFKVKFLTPAFLGNAEQSGQWRTPPFKAALRQWWRVVYAANREFDVDVQEMRRDEGLLFGNAWLESKHRKSKILLRLDKWSRGKLTKDQWRKENSEHANRITHCEVRGQGQIGPLLYLGYGPLAYQQGTDLKAGAAIRAGEAARLDIATPKQNSSDIAVAMALLGAYGTLGGRSRNGWGSLTVRSINETTTNIEIPQHHWRQAMQLHWPHAVGLDDVGPLVWQTTTPREDWRDVMRDLAGIKIELRTKFKFSLNSRVGDQRKGRGIVHGKPQDRHWLAYPVTNHDVKSWSGKRLPNSLRFKVRPDAHQPNRVRGVVFHMPCLPPKAFSARAKISRIEDVWCQVYEHLDGGRTNLERIPQ